MMIDERRTIRNIILTTSFAYTRDNIIGSGASSIVYCAVHRKTGQTVAAKVLKDHSKVNLQDLQREILSLGQLNHPNIIKFYGVEKELDTGRQVVLLQYCQSSLHSFLQEPENVHGICDIELIILFKDLCSALSYMRTRNIIHRDIKPGNVLRYTAPDLSIVYILSDFGTSRSLEDEGTYYSLVGTEEYLHPAVYEKAFVDRNVRTAFTLSTDLWSLACTLYQAVTSKMPFIPNAGAREDKNAMYEMISCKPSGALSGYQDEANGEIKWMTDFPTGCRSSRHLQELLKNIISKLLEADPQKQLSYEELFSEQRKLNKRFQLNIINTSDGTNFNLYFTPNDSLTQLKEEIARYTDVPAEYQTLYYDDLMLDKAVIRGSSLGDLFNQRQTNYIPAVFKHNLEEGLKLFKLESFGVYNNSSSVANDYDITFKRIVIVYQIIDLVYDSFHYQQKTVRTLVIMWAMIKTFTLKIEKGYECLLLEMNNMRYMLQFYRREVREEEDLSKFSLKSISDDIRHIDHRVVNGNASAQKYSTYSPEVSNMAALDKMEVDIKPVRDIIRRLNIMMEAQYNKMAVPQDSCTCSCLQKAKKYADDMKIILTRMKRRKKMEILPEEERILHLKDRNDVEELSASCLNLWQDHCWVKKQQYYKQFIHSKRSFHECHDLTLKANDRLRKIREKCNSFNDQIRKKWKREECGQF
ncbi:serine/threonine-protein kinase TBK1 isoform X2 [Patella vulgata]|uniref:serine/threonine-protein kinase TBK1 isoform X2 n=1 Tax=Patella vulgata TaxID=6465 RepID=UPI0021801536|nr:serine/threonine-protein kinase TBK1 isoform X2 [Patella vulgata]